MVGTAAGEASRVNAIKMAALILSLGIDNLMTSVSLGATNPSRRTRLVLALSFAAAEALMPLVGVAIGSLAGRAVGHWAPLLGAVALIGVGVWFVFFDDDDDDGVDVGERTFKAGSVLLLALSISIDELAAGFSMGLLGVPIVLTTILIAVEAFLFATVGMALGVRLKPLLGAWAEKIAGAVLGGLGIFMLIQFMASA